MLNLQNFCAAVVSLLFAFSVDVDAADEVPITGRGDRNLVAFDDLLTSFIREHNVPGGALAIAYRGKLVYSRGFGYSDRAHKTPVQPGSLFRVGSISKTLTAVAVLQLAEKKKLRLDDHVLDYIHLRPHLERGAKADPRWKDVTILELLQHTGGWDKEASSLDPMFYSGPIARAVGSAPPATPRDIIRYMLGKPLDFNPGERFAYSNFGYCLLGRVIETASGEPYERYVREQVLKPIGVTGIVEGHTLLSRRLPGEVLYYDQKGRTTESFFGPRGRVAMPYGAWCLEAMDSNGGWVASAPDLVRFAVSFDDREHCPVLSARSIDKMFARPSGAAGQDRRGRPAVKYYGCGWNVRIVGPGDQVNTWHPGSLDGAEAMLVRRADGVEFAVLFNTREDPSGKSLIELIERPLHETANAVKRWPDIDLFAATR
jgi:N-acyl-D-amino-acid deacylase